MSVDGIGLGCCGLLISGCLRAFPRILASTQKNVLAMVRMDWAGRSSENSLFKSRVTPARHHPRSISPETRTKTYLLLTWLWDCSSVTSLSFGFKTPRWSHLSVFPVFSHRRPSTSRSRLRLFVSGFYPSNTVRGHRRLKQCSINFFFLFNIFGGLFFLWEKFTVLDGSEKFVLGDKKESWRRDVDFKGSWGRKRLSGGIHKWRRW